MATSTKTPWIALAPPFRSSWASRKFTRHARALGRLRFTRADFEARVQALQAEFSASIARLRRRERQVLLASAALLSDLRLQRWEFRVTKHGVHIRPAEHLASDRIAEKERVRRQELVKRDAQLARGSVQRFIRGMERPRIYNGASVSVFSVMRDGRELAASLRAARKHSNNGWTEALRKVVDPYIQVIRSPECTCSQTGLPLLQMWRYFRHTWTNQYTTVPGRNMMFLVRDAAAPFHPVIGIGALSSPIMQLRERDRWIGWQPEAFLARITDKPTTRLAKWLPRVIDQAIDEVYVRDLLEEGVLTARHLSAPTEEVIKRLQRLSETQRRLHHRFVRAQEHKRRRVRASPRSYWSNRARMHLFKSKRALALATYLRVRMVVHRYLGASPTASKLKILAESTEGQDAIRKVLKKAKADRIGISVADISVCGAVQPYNAILGGKLVAMLAASPEIVAEYGRRYESSESEIASSMAGRPIVRKPHLVLLGTTSLYGVGSSQYNRVKIPCEVLDGRVDEALRYEELGYSEAFGTSQYSDETIATLTQLMQQNADGERVNSIFGEGVSPRLRKVRAGLDALHLPSDLLLKHHRRRIIYAVRLVRNLPDYLLGLQRRPDYVFSQRMGRTATTRVAQWWRERWLRHRIESDEVLDEVAKHTLVRPIRHGARVRLVVQRHSTGEADIELHSDGVP